MNRPVEIVALHTVHVKNVEGQQVVVKPKSTETISRDDYDELVSLQAVKAVNPSRDLGNDEDPHVMSALNAEAEAAAAKAEAEAAAAKAEAAAAAAKAEAEAAAAKGLTVKHKGGGRFIVLNSAGDQATETLFQSKEEAQAWVDAQPAAPASSSDDLL